MANPIVAFFNWAKGYAAEAWIAFKNAETITQISIALTEGSLAVGVKGWMQA